MPMPRVGSHKKCRRCGAARHRNTANGLCGRCWGEVGRPALVAERQAVKARRAAKRAASYDPLDQLRTSDIEAAFVRAAPDPIAAVMAESVREYVLDQEPAVALAMIDQASQELADEGTPMPTTRGRKPNLNPETKSEIADAYKAGMAISEILSAYGIGQGALYRIIHAAGVPLRGNGVVDSPADVAANAALADVKLPEPQASTYPLWRVTYEVVVRRIETTTIEAPTFLEAGSLVLQAVTEGAPETAADITKVERV